MGKNVVYIGFNNEYTLIADYLKERHDWDPVFFSCQGKTLQWAKEYYPNAVTHDEMSMRQANFDYSKIGQPVPIDAGIIDAISKYELSCLNMLEDTTGRNYSFYERRRYYYEIIKYWNTVIHKLKPDIYVCDAWPHTVTDYVLYLLCKYCYSIPTVFIDPVIHFNDSNVIGISMEDMAAPFYDIYNSQEQIDIPPDVSAFLDNLRGKKASPPDYIKESYEKLERKEKFQLRELMRLIILTLVRGEGFRKVPVAYKKNEKPFESSDSRMNWFEHFWFIDSLRRKNRRLKKIYTPLCSQPDFGMKYIYFAAPYQPEASNCPNARLYEDLFLVLDILSSSLPSGWVIYYKEHPGIFCGGIRGSLSRDRHFYEKIASYPNVEMIPIEIDTFKLIDGSQAVASVSGTVSWEAAVRGKPSLFFGNVWYQGCRSLFKVNTYQDCIEAIEKISDGYTPDQKDIERYVSAIKQVAVKGMRHRNWAARINECEDIKFEMEKIGRALHEAYIRHY